MQPQSQFDPGHAAFGGGSSGSVLHPVVLAALVLAVVLIFVLPRRFAVVPLLLTMLLTPSGQNLYIGGVHLFVTRLLILAGLVRVITSKAPAGFLPRGLATLDKIFLVWALYRATAVILLFGQTGAIVNQVGFLLDALGGYFVLRSLIREEQDVQTLVKIFAVVAVVSACEMIHEKTTGRNVFALLGGIRPTPEIRNGSLRAQAAFAISIAAGTFGATTFPLFVWLWSRAKQRAIALVAAMASTVMVFACASSTPVMAWAGGIGAMFLWSIRKKMRWLRWAIIAALLVLSAVMKAPVWFLIARVDLVSGSSGYDRALLIDNFIRHFSGWWLIGTHDNVNWGWDMWDQCNQFVTEGETGGLIAFVCFIAMFVVCFKLVGRARRRVEGNRRAEWSCWLLGVTIFAQILAFLGLDYFDQSIFVWYALLVAIPVVAAASRPAKAKAPAQSQSSIMAPDFSAFPTHSPVGVVGGQLTEPTPSDRFFD
ncbi:MAG: hypothetical protein ABSG07_10265 [Terriglobales bacterium]